MSHRYSSEQINEMLHDRVIELCGALNLGAGRFSGANYWIRDPRRKDGGNYSSFSINVRRGFWKNFVTDEGGDFIHLIAVFACAGDDARAILWAKQWLGLDGDNAPPPLEAKDIAARERERAAAEALRKKKNRGHAQRLWLEGRPLDGQDPVSCYLRDSRAIDVLKLKEGPPRALRYHSDCLAMPENVRLAAMVAAVSGGAGFLACHRTYLECVAGKWRKAFGGSDGSAKRVLGSYAGGSIRLTRGLSSQPLARAPKGEWIALAEGIENALTVALASPEIRCLAGVSLTNLGSIELPPQIAGVILIADNDSEAAPRAALEREMDKLLNRGLEPVIARIDGAKDFNELLTRA